MKSDKQGMKKAKLAELKKLEKQAASAKGDKRAKLLKQASNLRYIIKNMGGVKLPKKAVARVAKSIQQKVKKAVNQISTSPFSDDTVQIRLADTKNRGDMVIAHSDDMFSLWVELKEEKRTGWLLVDRKDTLNAVVSAMASYLLSNCETEFYKE